MTVSISYKKGSFIAEGKAHRLLTNRSWMWHNTLNISNNNDILLNKRGRQ